MNTPFSTRQGPLPSPALHPLERLTRWLSGIPDGLVLLLGRFSIAAVFWKSGQTKIEGLAIDVVSGEFQLGWPRLAESALFLFENEYRLPLLPPALAEHVFPILLLLGLATRLSALALLGMTLTIQLFVYPDAYPTHGVWATVLLVLIVRGAGPYSADHWLAGRLGVR